MSKIVSGIGCLVTCNSEVQKLRIVWRLRLVLRRRTNSVIRSAYEHSTHPGREQRHKSRGLKQAAVRQSQTDALVGVQEQLQTYRLAIAYG